jgi:hypothetical protein
MSKQVAGDHYSMEIPPVEYITRNKLDFNRGNIVKYVSRDKRKNKDEDIKKIIHYALLILQYDYKYTNEQINDVLEGFKCTQSK